MFSNFHTAHPFMSKHAEFTPYIKTSTIRYIYIAVYFLSAHSLIAHLYILLPSITSGTNKTTVSVQLTVHSNCCPGPIETDAVWLVCRMTSLTCEPIVSEKRQCHIVSWKFSTLKSFVSTCLIFFYVFLCCLRYKDLVVPTLGDKKKLSPEERCRSVLQQSKLQGWQVCVSFCFHQ